MRYSCPTPELSPEEVLLAAIVRRAIKDAQQHKDARLRDEAAAFLWMVAPCVAERVDLPAVIASDNGL